MLTLIIFIFIFFLFTFFIFTSIDAHVFIYGGCSQDKYPPNSPYEANKNSFLSSIAAASSLALYHDFAVGNDTAAPVFGLHQCRGDLSPRDCAACIAGAINQIAVLCPDTYGASLQLDACFLRYERADFLGRLDAGLRYRRCGGADGDAEFWRRRDGVLAELEAAAGFRVSAAGDVEGYAQCLGDLAAEDCSACLAEAVAKVKTLCGAAAAAAADVFLAQCYVRYWESGYYDSSSSDSSNGDDVGETVAIIVGVVAGVAVLIVFLSFCRKALG
ncbi:plasmodesmata-located protein 8 isoform X2 [Salvia miltiorrhiza]|nr:plasmodesmata-located protein 8 isoform X2 [Salvia miltiorrhiza]